MGTRTHISEDTRRILTAEPSGAVVTTLSAGGTGVPGSHRHLVAVCFWS